MTTPVYAAALSQHPVPVEAVGECAGELLERLGGARADLLVVFASAHYAGAFADVCAALRTLLQPESMIGCTAVAIVGGGLEVEDDPALSVWAASWGGGRARAFGLQVEREPDGTRIAGWPDDLPPHGTLLVLADPFSFPVGDFLELTNAGLPGLTVIGGLASAARGPGGNRLVLDGVERSEGAVAVLLDDRVPVSTAVSQGCRPIGQPFTITAAERNLVHELAGKPALVRLQEVADALPDDDRALLQGGLHVGIVVDEHKFDFGSGDFLVRNVLGGDGETGTLAVGERVEIGQTIQFHVRDADSADADLRHVLARTCATVPTVTATLLFTCNGRGRHLFGSANHDAALVQDIAGGPFPQAGMFCTGELGPVGRRAYLHGFTASIAVFGDQLDLSAKA